MREADWKDRRGMEWEPGYSFTAKRGFRNLELPSNPFDFVRLNASLTDIL